MDTSKKPPLTGAELEQTYRFLARWLAQDPPPASWRTLGKHADVHFTRLYAIAKKYRELKVLPAADFMTVAGIAHAYEAITRQKRVDALKARFEPKPKRTRQRGKTRKKGTPQARTKRTRRAAPRRNPDVRSGPADTLE